MGGVIKDEDDEDDGQAGMPAINADVDVDVDGRPDADANGDIQEPSTNTTEKIRFGALPLLDVTPDKEGLNVDFMTSPSPPAEADEL